MMSNHIPQYLPLPQLQKVTQHLAAHAFHPHTSRNHTLQSQSFIQFCDLYHLHFLDPDVSTVCLYITHLTCHCLSTMSLESGPSTRKWVSLQWPWSPSRCLACSGRPTSPCKKATPCDVFSSFPTAPSPLWINHFSPNFTGGLHHGHYAHPVPSPDCPPPPPRVLCWLLLLPQLIQREGHGGLQAGFGPDEHQTAGTVDQ